MPSRKGDAKRRQFERKGDFSLDAGPRLTKHAQERMKERNVPREDIIKGKASAGVISDEATGTVITVIPDHFIHLAISVFRRPKLSTWP